MQGFPILSPRCPFANAQASTSSDQIVTPLTLSCITIARLHLQEKLSMRWHSHVRVSFPRGLVFPLGYLDLLDSHIFSRSIKPFVRDPIVHPLSRNLSQKLDA
jgi:hypothetical protein